MSAATQGAEGIGIYLHWPFCLAKCPYCDFNSHVRASVDAARWRAALERELAHFRAVSGPRAIASVFLGGGTPSLMPPAVVADLLSAIDRLWGLPGDSEITLEANPTSAEAGSFAGFRQAGVNRLSVGVQALDDEALAFLGRRHSSAEALKAVALARRHFPRRSFDLIYARPGQTPASWQAELSRALAEEPTHLSLYQLTIEPGTVFEGRVRRGELALPGEEELAALYESTQETLEQAGLPAYEISNHARPGEESRHNLIYWRYGEYLGIGPGAHGRLQIDGMKRALRQHRAPEAWLMAVERDGHATRHDAVLSRRERLVEMTMMGLRLKEGIPCSRFHAELGAGPEALFQPARLAALQQAGLLELEGKTLRASTAGRQRLDGLLAYLLEDLPQFAEENASAALAAS